MLPIAMRYLLRCGTYCDALPIAMRYLLRCATYCDARCINTSTKVRNRSEMSIPNVRPLM